MTSKITRIKPSLSGKAIICCVHDREKRVIVTEADVATLGLELGIIYNKSQHKLFKCSCCENLFVGFDNTPKYCHQCRTYKPLHPVMAPLVPPVGPLD